MGWPARQRAGARTSSFVNLQLYCSRTILFYMHIYNNVRTVMARKNVYVFMLIKLKGQMHFDGRE